MNNFTTNSKENTNCFYNKSIKSLLFGIIISSIVFFIGYENIEDKINKKDIAIKSVKYIKNSRKLMQRYI
jgi:hypothetical protein